MRRVLLPGLLLAAHAALGLWSARSNSATYDEPPLVAAGYSYWTHDLRLDKDIKNPPLALLALSAPLLSQKILFMTSTREWNGAFAEAFGERFFFWDGNDSETMLFSARLVNVALSLFLALMIWRRATTLWGERAGLAALAFYCLSPNILAYASLATTDFPVAFCIAVSMLAFCGLVRRPGARTGLLLAAAALAGFFCKHTALLVWPACAVCLAARRLLGRAPSKSVVKSWLVFALLPWLAAVAAVFWLLPELRHSFQNVLADASRGHGSFLLGAVSQRGWPQYYAVALAVKSTLPELLVVPLGGLWLARREIEAAPEVLASAVMIAILFASGSASHKQLGIRYVLGIYPLLALLAGAAARKLLDEKRGKVLVLALAAWQAASAAGVAPQFVAYFNEAAGGPANGLKILGDSNVDWGQDLKRLGAFMKSNPGAELILCYFGTASPETYGMRPQQYLSSNAIQRREMNSEHPAREFLAVSATHLQGIYLDPKVRLDWLSRLEPTARPGYGILVYDVTDDAFAHRKLMEGYLARGDKRLADREARRAASIEAAFEQRSVSIVK